MNKEMLIFFIGNFGNLYLKHELKFLFLLERHNKNILSKKKINK